MLITLTMPVAARYLDGPTLYQATIRENPDSWLAHSNLAASISPARHRICLRP